MKRITNCPVAFASRTLSNTERNHAQIQKEMLAAMHGSEKNPSLHTWTPGPCDHWPQTSSCHHRKPLSKAPSVHASSGTSLQLYHQLQVRCPIPVANALSRAPTTTQPPDIRVWESQFACRVTVQTSPTEWDQTGDSCRLHTNGTHGHHHQRMAQRKSKVPLCITPYFDYRDELTVQDVIVLRGERVVIPTSMQKELKAKVHAGHSSIISCLRRARELIFWSRMLSKIRQYTESCVICAYHGTKQSPKYAVS